VRPVPHPSVVASPAQAAIVATIERVFGPREGLIALNVADCESGDGPNVPPGPPYSIDPTQVYKGNVGAFQIHLVDHEDAIARHGFTDADMTRIEPNAIVAKDIHDAEGWGPWSCKTHAVAV